MAESNPQIAEVMNSLVNDPNAKQQNGNKNQAGLDDNDARSSKNKSVLGRITDKVKGSTKQGIALATKRMSDTRGQQL
jgi:hypothetical protein